MMLRRCVVGLFGILLLLFLFLWAARQREGEICFCPVRFEQYTLILDAGHGGEDGGAISLTGTPESGINLDIVLKMRDICGFWGIPAVLTRDGDYSLSLTDSGTVAQRKRSDLEQRIRLIEKNQPCVLISVHQNIYSSLSAKGGQVFFAPTRGSDAWGVYTQDLLARALQPDNTRQSKQITGDIYLLNHISCPAILVECGFLSNPEESSMLEQSEYQTKLALVLADSYLTYFFD